MPPPASESLLEEYQHLFVRQNEAPLENKTEQTKTNLAPTRTRESAFFHTSMTVAKAEDNKDFSHIFILDVR